MTRRRKPTLAALYAQVPRVHCRGLCSDQCTTLAVAPAERKRIAKAGGLINEFGSSRLGEQCPSLVDGRCSIYRDRPLLCRLFGATAGLPCPHGCKIDGGPIGDDVAAWLIRKTHEIEE